MLSYGTKFNTEVCERCGREHYVPHAVSRPWCGAYVTVKHDFYGCDTGCCGHSIYLYDENDHEVARAFEFDHLCNETKEEFCRDLSEQHFPGISLRLEECEAVDD